MGKEGVYKVTDHTGARSTHFAMSPNAAIQAHLLHYELLCLDQEPKVEWDCNLIESKRDVICWDPSCMFAAMGD